MRTVKHRHDTAHEGNIPANQLGFLTWKTAVRVATTANGTLATAFENGDTIDGVVLATGDRILLKNQTTGQNNGIYTVNASGAPTRALDMDAADEVKGAVTFVREGTVNAGTLWRNTNTGAITIGTTPLTFAAVGSSLFSLDGSRARLIAGPVAVSQTDTGTVADLVLGSTPGFAGIDSTFSQNFTVVTAGHKHYLNGGSGLVIPILSADPAGGDSEEGQVYFNDVSATIRWYDGAAWADVGAGGGAHASTHEDGGADEIDVTGLTGAGGSGYAEGTSFPGSPSTDDKFYRTDLDLLCYYDGTRWLTVNVYEVPFPQDSGINTQLSAAAVNVGRLSIPWRGTHGVYLIRFQTVTTPVGTNNGTSHWTIKLNWATAADADTQIGSTMNTSADTTNQNADHSQALTTVVDATARMLKLRVDKVVTPGNLLINGLLSYRLIVT